jgi:hypothetical protein
MKTLNEKDRAYVSPTSAVIPFQLESVLCESPLPGGNEGIGFEPWN